MKTYHAMVENIAIAHLVTSSEAIARQRITEFLTENPTGQRAQLYQLWVSQGSRIVSTRPKSEPWYTITDPRGEKVAQVRDAVLAALVVGNCGNGSIVKYGRKIVWQEGQEEFGACWSYDQSAQIMIERITGE